MIPSNIKDGKIIHSIIMKSLRLINGYNILILYF